MSTPIADWATEDSDFQELLAKPIYPWFGSKRRIAKIIWEAFGDVDNFVDPFLGTNSVLLSAPWPADRLETVNDKDRFIANAWRAIQWAPEEVATHANWPVNEADLESRHAWLVSEGAKKLEPLMADPRAFDAEIAGWWIWGQCCWIGSGWCSGNGPWTVGLEGFVRNAGKGVNRKRPHLGDAGQGVNRKLPHLGDAGKGVNRKRPHLRNAGKGVNRQLPHLGNAGQGGHYQHLVSFFHRLATRLRYVRVCCGDWSRVLTPSVTFTHGSTGIILDPPYADTANRTSKLYSQDCDQVSKSVREWALENGDNPLLRIVLCGYDGEHDMPPTWRVHQWSATGGYSGFAKQAQNGKANKHRERLWFSPHCKQSDTEKSLFDD